MVMFDTTPKCNLLLQMCFQWFWFCVDGCSLILTQGQSTCLMVGTLLSVELLIEQTVVSCAGEFQGWISQNLIFYVWRVRALPSRRERSLHNLFTILKDILKAHACSASLQLVAFHTIIRSESTTYCWKTRSCISWYVAHHPFIPLLTEFFIFQVISSPRFLKHQQGSKISFKGELMLIQPIFKGVFFLDSHLEFRHMLRNWFLTLPPEKVGYIYIIDLFWIDMVCKNTHDTHPPCRFEIQPPFFVHRLVLYHYSIK